MSDCIGHTKKGAPCKKRKAIGSDYCGVHEDERQRQQRQSSVHESHSMERAIFNHGFRGIDNISQVKLLLDKEKFNVNAKLPCGKLPTELALERGGNEVSLLKLLLKHKADPNQVFISAVRQGLTDAVKLLIKYKADVNFNNPLTFAIDWGNNTIIQKLLHAKADPNQLNTYHESYIASAIRRGNVKAIDLLLEAKADPNTGSVSPINLLLTTTSLSYNVGYQPFAQTDEKSAVISKLINAKADPNATGRDGVSPLVFTLSRSAPLEVIKCLLDAKADPNQLSPHHNNRNIEQVKKVPSLGAIVVSQGYENNPIEYAKLLMQYGAHPTTMVGGLDLFTIITKSNLYNITSDPRRFRELLQYFVDNGCQVQLDREQIELPNNFLEIIYEELERSRGEIAMLGILKALTTGPVVNGVGQKHYLYTKDALRATMKLSQSQYTRKYKKKNERKDSEKKDDDSSSSSS